MNTHHPDEPASLPVEHPHSFWWHIRRYLVAGLLIWAPLAATGWIVVTLVNLMDMSLLLLPSDYRPSHWLPFPIPGLGIVLALSILLLTGLVAANYLGRRLVGLGESILDRIPFVRSIYSGIKQLLETFLSKDSRSFRKVLLVEYPSKGLWTLAFLAGDPVGEIQQKTASEVLTIYVPTAPNPTSGYVIFVPKDEAIELEMSVEDAMRMIVSLGMVVPAASKAEAAAQLNALAAPASKT
ncbi:MAG: hypothetical protein B7Y40_08510 [Gammaproteobacteria bacterium 28-57-27]|nr:MAG: hypothetical protein B7Y40_08510 [Gammaproteobacteria bacterium 28-57-27]